MDENEVVGGVAENEANESAAEATTDQTEALRAAFLKGWDSALSYRREHGAEDDAARAASEPGNNEPLPDIDDPITREINDRAEKVAERKALLASILSGPDVASWVAPKEGVVSDEVLVEHLAQLRNVVRFTLAIVVDDYYRTETSLSAANTATRMIRANIALAKELKTSNSKTVRGGKRKKRAQD